MLHSLPCRASSAQIKSIKHRSIQVNGIKMHIAEQGEGPLMVLRAEPPWIAFEEETHTRAVNAHGSAAISAAILGASLLPLRGFRLGSDE
jgi:hypothetical protein